MHVVKYPSFDLNMWKPFLACCCHSVVSNSLRPCPSPSPGACSNSRPLSQWCHWTISSSVVPFSSCLQSFPASGSFLMSRLFTSGGQTFGSFSFSISPSNEYPGLISFRMDWLDLLAVQGTLKSSPVPQLELAHGWRCWILSQSHSVASSDATQYSEGEAALVILPAIRSGIWSKTLDLPWGISALVFSSALWCCPQSPSSLMQEWMNDGKACKEPWIQVQTSFLFWFPFFFHVHCVFETFYSFLATCAKGLLVLRMAVVLMR